MRRQLTARTERFALRTPFRIARGVKTVAEVVTVTLVEEGFIGRGEGVPYARYGESVAGALAAITAAAPEIEDGAGRHALLDLMPPGAARNAIDCALWDLELKRSAHQGKTSQAEDCKPLVTALTIGIDTPEAMGTAARGAAGAPLLKMKVDADDPPARLRAVRAAAPDARLIVDPNESWDRALLTHMLPICAAEGVAVIEQPVPADDDAWLAGFERPVLIAADEAVHTASDLDHVAARYDVVNVKLDKAGGLTAALMLAEETRTRGLGLMTGCMISTSLSIAPALTVARMSDFVDLDGPLWLAEDRPDGVRADAGWLHPPAPEFWG